jgi:hypothetical protein
VNLCIDSEEKKFIQLIMYKNIDEISDLMKEIRYGNLYENFKKLFIELNKRMTCEIKESIIHKNI